LTVRVVDLGRPQVGAAAGVGVGPRRAVGERRAGVGPVRAVVRRLERDAGPGARHEVAAGRRPGHLGVVQAGVAGDGAGSGVARPGPAVATALDAYEAPALV